MNIAVFASGSGSNFQALVEACRDQNDFNFVLLFSDYPQAYALERANKLGIPSLAASPKDFNSRDEYEEFLLRKMEDYQVDYILLAGYMRIIGQDLLEAYPDRILNIHPSLLPAFPGRHGIADAYRAGVKETGVTVHLVDQGIDTGRILKQAKVLIEQGETLADLEEKIHQVEHQLYPQVVKEYLKGVE
ncbi:phosphoribosylglycinamide formyltransferase [Facklamia miroungae]|uniref:Phosphoribosylglycinamide formyltransferase n=1 Tax=Facklamia miroungae TaxID=120956 RepID=A0A1G7P5Q9_9LACT|nr:phosphoribosylglycinamide formyltransferase [Facklamia miroungae]NKZ28590.1 phosphoribosylglycinamide formyltransferase [Facklamia miroungae]SDF81593.1 phosphoribosylglycinamide formyltransferase-1 [Facklamia miroungae]